MIFLHKRYPKPFPQDEMMAMIAEKTEYDEAHAKLAIEEVFKTAEIDEVFLDGKLQYVFVQPGERHVVIGKRQEKWFDSL